MRITTPLLLTAALAALSSSAQTPTLVRDFHPGSVGAFINHGDPHAFRIHDGRLLLFANDALAVTKLYALDDLSGNVQELAQVGNVLGYTTTNGGIVASGDNLFFFAQQQGSINTILWCLHDGAVAPMDTIPYQVLFYHTGIPLPGGRLLFPNSDPDHGFEPWVTDGTAAGTHRLLDVNAGSAGSLGSPFPLFQGFDFGGRGYFLADDGSNGMQLWTSDGTAAGTQLFAQVNDPGQTGAIALRYSKNAEKFIVATTEGLLASDGNTATNGIIHDAMYAWPHTAGLTYPEAPDDGWMYFSALEDQWKLYRTRGTEATTELVLAGVPNQGFFHLTELDGRLYAFNADNEHVFLVGIDPAAQASAIVKTFEPDPMSGPNPGAFYGFRNDGERFYFMGKEGSHGRQYWQSDGTLDGTRMVHEFMPNVLNGGPDAVDGNMIIFQNTFVFAANDAEVGAELWAGGAVSAVAEAGAGQADVKAWCDGNGQLQVRARMGHLTAVRLMDAAGRAVDMRSGLAGDSLAVPVRSHPAGVYLVQVSTTGGSATVRLVLP